MMVVTDKRHPDMFLISSPKTGLWIEVEHGLGLYYWRAYKHVNTYNFSLAGKPAQMITCESTLSELLNIYKNKISKVIYNNVQAMEDYIIKRMG